MSDLSVSSQNHNRDEPRTYDSVQLSTNAPFCVLYIRTKETDIGIFFESLEDLDTFLDETNQMRHNYAQALVDSADRKLAKEEEQRVIEAEILDPTL